MTLEDNTPEWVKIILVDVFVDTIPILLITFGSSGVIQFVSPPAEKLFGYSSRELIGKQIEILIPERFRRPHLMRREVFLKDSGPRLVGRGCDLCGKRKDGSEFPMEVSLTFKTINRITYVLVQVTDITGRKQKEEERSNLFFQKKLAQQLKEQAKWKTKLLTDVSRALCKSLDYQTILKNVAKVIVPRFSDWCIVGLLQEDKSIRLVALAAHISKLRLLQKLARFAPDSNTPEGLPKAIRTGRAILYSEVSEMNLSPDSNSWPFVGSRDPEYLRILRELNLKSYMAIPLFVRNKTIGAIFIASSEKTYNESDLATGQEIGYRCSMAIENASLYQEAKMAIRIREDFLSIASHELNTPLTSLAMQIQMLNRYIKQGILSKIPREKLLEMTKISEQQVRRFTSLINDLLDVSRIAAGRLVINIEDVNFSDLIKNSVERHKEELKIAQCPIEIKVTNSIIGHWDRTRIEQVVTNLLMNAMKYGAGKPIEIQIQKEEEKATLTVRDHGIGISQEDQARIFQRFERAVSIKEFGGLGLGLFIVRQIVHAHGGSIRVESKLGHGSAFIVELPLKGSELKLVVS